MWILQEADTSAYNITEALDGASDTASSPSPSYSPPAYSPPKAAYTPPVDMAYIPPKVAYTPPVDMAYSSLKAAYTPPVDMAYSPPKAAYTPPVASYSPPDTTAYTPPDSFDYKTAYAPGAYAEHCNDRQAAVATADYDECFSYAYGSQHYYHHGYEGYQHLQQQQNMKQKCNRLPRKKRQPGIWERRPLTFSIGM